MSKAAFEKKVAEITSLREALPDPAAILQVRKALQDKNNFLVSKAAAVAGHWREQSLLADLEDAFNRFLENAVKSDPQCWAKIAIVKALKNMDHRVATVYLRGLAHVQLEPVWGGSADTAAGLRGACALALVACHMNDLEILRHLSAPLADPEKTVRTDAATAIAQLGLAEGALLLRLKALLPDPEPEVLGQVLSSLIQLEDQTALPFVISFLHRGNEESRLEAIAALAPSLHPEALVALQDLWKQQISIESRRAIVQSLAASPLAESTTFLLRVVQGQSSDLAADAIASLAASRFRDDAKPQVAALLGQLDDSRLGAAFRREFN